MNLQQNALVLALATAALASAPALAGDTMAHGTGNNAANKAAFDTPSEVVGQPANRPQPRAKDEPIEQTRAKRPAFDTPSQVAGAPAKVPPRVDKSKPDAKAPPIDPAAFDTPAEVVGR